MRSVVTSTRLLLAACCLAFAGCSTGPKVYHVSGKVAFRGEPLPAGVIFFDPDSTKGNSGPQGYAAIKDGRYDTADLGGQGVGSGPYQARIDGFDGKPARELPMGRPLFSRYLQSIDLPMNASTQDFDVPEPKE